MRRFYDIAWGPPDADHPNGIIAGAMENGSLDLWDAEKLQAGSGKALMSQTVKHTGAIKTLQFNPLKPQILATAGTKGEIFIYDINDIANPFRLGNAAARADDVECLAWNRKVSHILATGGSGGFVTVWDLKTKKASLTLNNNRKAVSAIAWDPNNSTKLLTATPDDTTPVIFLWDLRNSNAPEKTLQGHEQGVLSLSWCHQDSSILLSSGKDNKTIVWNPQTGERSGELPEVTNWTFQTRFNPHNPNLSATASFDGKITIQTLQNTNPDASQATVDQSLDGEDFFRAAQTQPQGASWSLSKAPKWFERPVGASFGFGGKIVIFKPTPGKERSSQVVISHFSADSDISSATEKFQEALGSGDIAALCEDRMASAKTDEEKNDWKVMQTLIGDNPRGKIVEYLGFKEAETTADDGETPEVDNSKEEAGDDNGKKKRLSKLFDGADGEGDDEDFLGNVPATKGAKTDDPFHLFNEKDTSVEKDITKALMLGNFAKATDLCLKEERMADAFLIANCGGQELVDKVQAAYLAQKTGAPSYLRLLGSVIDKNLWDVVYNADLASWKETMAIICTFSDPVEFPDLCEALGDRIKESGERKDASFCYLVGSKLEKVVSIWATELEETEAAGMKESSEDSTFSVHARSLQNFIEKVTVFRQVSKFVDNEKSETSEWKLSALYDKYTEYADILAGHGQLQVAQKYLDLLPAQYPAAEAARSRVKQATGRSATKPAAKQPAVTQQRVQPSYGFQPQTQPMPPAGPANPYGAMNPVSAPQQPQQQQAYMPSPYQPQGMMYQPPGQAGYSAPTPPPMGGPPRNSTPVASTQRKGPKESWNDVPLVAKAPPPRRSTPNAMPGTSPYAPQQGQSPPPPPNAFGQPAQSSPPPPPKGPAPPRVTSPLAAQQPTSFQAPPPPRPSSAANQYAPPPPQAGAAPPIGQVPSAVPRTASPYNAPPAGAPPSNRYAPAPAAQQQSTGTPLGGAALPPPPPAAANPYSQFAQQAPPASSSNPYAPPPANFGAPPNQAQGGMQPPPPSGPPTGPPPMGRPPGGPTPTPPPPKAAAASPKPKHPPGDRSHIPANAQHLVDVLTQDMQRVAAKAPATFAAQVKDTEKRLNILFDHLNNEELVKPATIDQLTQLADGIQSKDYATAQKIQNDIQRNKTGECGNWMVSLWII